MKINGVKVVGYDQQTGMLLDANGVPWSILPDMDISFDDEAQSPDVPVSSKDSPIDFIRAGMSSDDLVKLKEAGII